MSTLSSDTGTASPSLHMTEEEFVRWADEDTHAEWVAGKVQIKMPIDRIHGAIQFWLRSLVQAFVQKRKLGFVEGPQFTIRLTGRPSRRDPDLLFVAAENQARVQRTYVDGPADLVMEVVSPDSVSRDYREKYIEYQAAGVREYWIVDPLQSVIELHVLGADGKYSQVEPKDGRLHSAMLPGFWLRPADPFKDPLPDVNAVLREMEA
jgi:Uma2 family endonuclease